MAIAGVVAMLAIVHVAIVGSVAAGARESDVQSLRIESLRAAAAADTGAMMWMRLDAAGDVPASGDAVSYGDQTILFVESPQIGEGNVVVIEGRSGRARRRLELVVE